jgi:hypothetical protein
MGGAEGTSAATGGRTRMDDERCLCEGQYAAVQEPASRNTTIGTGPRRREGGCRWVMMVFEW